MELSSVEMKNMEAILEKYERIVMDCAVQQTGEFSVAALHSALCGMGEIRLSKTGVQQLLDRLVKKKLMKKRYVRIKYLKFEPLYCSRFHKDFYLSHIQDIDLSNKRHKKAWDTIQARKHRLENNSIYRFLHYDLTLGIIEQEYLSEKERKELKKKIADL